MLIEVFNMVQTILCEMQKIFLIILVLTRKKQIWGSGTKKVKKFNNTYED
jgi:hypothetical protein